MFMSRSHRQIGLDKDATESIYRWIVATASHQVGPGESQDCGFFMDFDMSILGASWPEYQVYMAEVKDEYQILLGQTADDQAWEITWATNRPKFMWVRLQILDT